jgi:curved DNA-binding protein CbpA
VVPPAEAPADLEVVRLVADELYAGLDSLPYHVFLGVLEHVKGDELRSAFHARAQLLHPDQFYELDDAELKMRIYRVYMRITEAYRVLADPVERAQYEHQRASDGAIRIDKTTRPIATIKRPEDAILNPQAKKYYLLASEAERRGDRKGARLNLQLAMQMDPTNPVIKERLEKLK